jgi:hypothetical protein
MESCSRHWSLFIVIESAVIRVTTRPAGSTVVHVKRTAADELAVYLHQQNIQPQL